MRRQRAVSFGAATFIALFAITAHAHDKTSVRPGAEVYQQRLERDAWTARTLVPHRLELRFFVGPTAGPAPSILGASHSFGVDIHHTHPSAPAHTAPTGAFTPTQDSTTLMMLPLGISVGVAKNLEVGIALPIYLNTSDFGNLPLWVTYQLMDNDTVQLGVRAAVYFPIDSPTGAQLGIPVRIRAGNVRIDTGAFATLAFRSTMATRIFIPARLGVQINPSIYAGAQTEFAFEGVGGAWRFQMPIYAFVGYTIHGGLGPIDLALRAGFDHAVRAGTGVQPPFEFRDFSIALGGNITLQF